MLIKRFISDEQGNVALEAIWSVLTLAVFLLPTVMLFEIMDTQLDNNIGVRSAARNEAINSNCNGNFFIPLPGGGKNVWAEGHDQAIWNKLPRTPRDRLFSKVFPSAN